MKYKYENVADYIYPCYIDKSGVVHPGGGAGETARPGRGTRRSAVVRVVG
ncbi:17264_t:CDS:1, partial [Dentiscutata erythropus]